MSATVTEEAVSPAATGQPHQAVGPFEDNRGLLFGVAYRVLGSVDDAEDVVQEAWLRWSRVDAAQIDNPQSFLVRIASRLALDRLRRVKARRETYVGPWLPQPLFTGPGIEEGVEIAESVSMAMLVVMETLSPLERVVFVLREVFEFSFADIASAVDRSESAVRQLASRARTHVHDRRPRFPSDQAVCRRVTERFLAASLGADVEGLLGLLAPDVTVWNDGNGRRGVPRTPVHGAERVGRLLVHGIERFLRPLATCAAGAPGGVLTGSVISVNGGPAGLITAGDEPVGLVVLDLEPAGERVTRVWIMANQDKLAGMGGTAAGFAPTGGDRSGSS
ncbi:RNA polymerase sigma factor SigJ [Streptomyces sp. NPDC021020]|uniref:RNA polymerase sigma factor SigJ n=1 Tax=Streptomyces sp. NPDC021020 TaxID=3365109 RepID=UPI0037AF6A13